MKKYKIITESGCDLCGDMLKELELEYLKLPLLCGDEDGFCDLEWKNMSAKEFYQKMRDGARFRTSQINIERYVEAFEKAINEGFDVLSLTMSSGLSGSYNSSLSAQKQVMEKYPDAKIICIDTLRGSLGEGLILYHAAKQRQAGKSIDEVAAWVEDNKLKVHQVGTVGELEYLKRAGRVSGTAAFMGAIFKIKPILISNSKGENYSIGKVKGRVKSLEYVFNYVKQHIVKPEEQIVFIVHADCIDDATAMEKRLKDELGVKQTYINYVGPATGASVGPGMIGVYYFGEKVTM